MSAAAVPAMECRPPSAPERSERSTSVVRPVYLKVDQDQAPLLDQQRRLEGVPTSGAPASPDHRRTTGCSKRPPGCWPPAAGACCAPRLDRPAWPGHAAPAWAQPRRCSQSTWSTCRRAVSAPPTWWTRRCKPAGWWPGGAAAASAITVRRADETDLGQDPAARQCGGHRTGTVGRRLESGTHIRPRIRPALPRCGPRSRRCCRCCGTARSISPWPCRGRTVRRGTPASSDSWSAGRARRTGHHRRSGSHGGWTAAPAADSRRRRMLPSPTSGQRRGQNSGR